jgi:hypothetical protein
MFRSGRVRRLGAAFPAGFTMQLVKQFFCDLYFAGGHMSCQYLEQSHNVHFSTDLKWTLRMTRTCQEHDNYDRLPFSRRERASLGENAVKSRSLPLAAGGQAAYFS